ncbi:MAG: hypothetical protein IJB75_05815 [Oscillospiraceae bacterium]|nr:hypothetical protein [Oscillospiraceae bacterium]
MTERYQIAELLVDMDTFGRTKAQAQHYRYDADGEADIVVKSNASSLKTEQPHLSDDDCEYISTGSNFYRQLLKFDGMVLHSSAVVVDGYAYLFTAHSGTGKSTHTKLWCKEFADKGAYILNDDKPALRLMDDGVFYAYGTPWSGKATYSPNRKVPLGGVCLLHRGAENKIRPCTAKEAIFFLLTQTSRPIGQMGNDKILTLLDKLLTKVPVWHLECNMEPEAAHVSYNAMSMKERNE